MELAEQLKGNVLQESTSTGLAILLSGPINEYGARSHAMLLLVDGSPEVIIHDGLASGYRGEGPAGLCTAICLLHSRGWDINEVELTGAIFERVCAGEASQTDLDGLLTVQRRPISDVFRYLPLERLNGDAMRQVWRSLPIVLPLPLMDQRLFDIAIRFWDDPDAQLSKAYRRLEDIARQKSGLNGPNDYGAKLFSRAFGTDNSPLAWMMNGAESICYAPLFTASFSGFRNNRAHRDPGNECEKALAAELLQLNMLYRLEDELTPRRSHTADGSA